MTNLEGHNIYDQFFWSCAICHGHVRSYMDNPTWQYCDQIRRSLIEISPAQIGVFYGASPTIQPISIFSPVNLVSYMGLLYHFRLFIFSPWPIWPNRLYFSFSKKVGLLFRWVPMSGTCRRVSSRWFPPIRIILHISFFQY